MGRMSHVLVAGGVTVAMATTGGAVWATASSGAPSSIHACVTQGGTIRIVNGPEHCNGRGETPLSWDRTQAPAQRWFADRDVDGFGDWYDRMDSPARPSGYVANNDDCNDDHADVNPGTGTDAGVGWDFDCDGLANEAGTWWYPDADGDGLGSFAGRFQGSTDGNPPQPGAVRAADDCDDNDPAITTECRTGNFDYWYFWSEEDARYVRKNLSRHGYSPGDHDVDGHFAAAEYYTGTLPADWTTGDPGPGDDCDDHENRVYPGADEIRYDGLDNDCNPVTLDVEPYVDDVGRHDPDGWGIRTP